MVQLITDTMADLLHAMTVKGNTQLRSPCKEVMAKWHLNQLCRLSACITLSSNALGAEVYSGNPNLQIFLQVP